MFWFWIIGAAIGALLVTTYIVYEIISRDTIKEKAKVESPNAIQSKIKKIYQDGDYTVVKAGLLDYNDNEIGEIEIKSEKGYYDNIYEGLTLWN